MLLFYVSDSESNITFLTQGLSTDAIDSGVLLLRSDDLKSSATLRDHPYMTSAKFWDFLTPPLSAFGTDLQY